MDFSNINSTSIGERIAFYRKAIDMSAPELAEKCDLTPGYINNLERGIGTIPTIDTLYLISKNLKIDMDRLLEDNLSIYHGIEIESSIDKDILSAFYTLSRQKKECILEILRAYITSRGILTQGEVEEENEYLKELKKQMTSSTYIQEMIAEVIPLSETEQQCALDILRNTINSIGKLTGGEQDV